MEPNKQNSNNNTSTTQTAPSNAQNINSAGSSAVIKESSDSKNANTSFPTTNLGDDNTVNNTADTLKNMDQAIQTMKNVSTNSATGSNDVFTQIAQNIIREQEIIIGPVALEQAMKVVGLKIDLQTNAITIQGNKREVLERLVKQYELLFGRISIEICKEAVRNIISQAPRDQVPQILL